MRGKATGIELLQQEAERKPRVSGLGSLIMLVYFYLGVYGCVFSFLGVFEVPCDRVKLCAVIFAFGICFFLISRMGKYGKYAVLVMLLVYGVAVFWNLKLLRSGGEVLFEAVRRMILLYQNDTDIGRVDLVYGMQILYALLAVLFPWSGILFYWFVVRGGRMFVTISEAVVFSAALAVGQVPDFVPLAMMAGCFAGACAAGGLEEIRGQRAGALLLLAAVMVLLLAAGNAFLAPVLAPWFADKDEIKVQVQESSMIRRTQHWLEQWEGPWGTVGIGTGELGNTEFLKHTEEVVLQVTVPDKPEETVYLRRYTGADYTGTEWKEREDSLDAQMQAEYFSRFRRVARDMGYPDPYHMEIRMEEHAGAYAYQPYFSVFYGEKEGVLAYDYYPTAMVGEWYWGDLLAVEWMDPAEVYWDSLVSDGQWADLPEKQEAYHRFAYENYCFYPEERLQRLKALCDANPQQTVQEIRDFIVSYLKRNASYNLNVGRFPSGEEFTEYFLFEKHQGYCVHFATAATLMFRMYGLPARYVTGYVAPAKSFRKKGHQYVAKVKDTRAHAWAEIYIDGQGWVPVEATPGYAETAGNQETELQNLTEENRQEESAVMTERQRETQEPSEQDFGKKLPKAALWILPLLMFTAVALFVRRRRIIKSRCGKDVKEIFYDVCRVMEFAGFSEKADCQEAAFPEQAVLRFPWLNREDFAHLIDLAVRANFDQIPMTEEERQFARSMYREICQKIYGELSGVRKLIFRFWFCVP